MKKRIFTIATLFVAAAISVAVVSCQKDNETENENQVVAKSANDESRELLNRIYAFQELRDNVRSGAKSGESMTLEQLRDDIDLTFNYEHSQHATPFANASLDTFYVRMPQVDANGNVSATEAIATYNAFETELAELMADVDDDSNLAKNFSIKFPETGAKSGDAIEVVFTRGDGNISPSRYPFEKGDDYKWGLMLGRCDQDSSVRITDAANELTRLFQFKPNAEHEGGLIAISNVEYVRYKPYEEYGLFLDNYLYYEDPTITNGLRWLYIFSGDCQEEPCIEYDELNFYYESINRNVVSPRAPLHYGLKTNSPYHECVIEGTYNNILYKHDRDENQNKRDVRVHTIVITYCELTYGSHE